MHNGDGSGLCYGRNDPYMTKTLVFSRESACQIIPEHPGFANKDNIAYLGF